MSRQRVRGNRNVQIQDVHNSVVPIAYDGATRTVPLEPAHVPPAARLPSPARLIRAHSGVVPYVERAGLLSDLEAWIDSPAPFAGQVIGGRGGSGKTRLAVEACAGARQSKWLCGFLQRDAGEARLDALVEAPTARLVIVDYAETRPEQVEGLLPLLSAKATGETPVRVLLLVRGGPEGAGHWASRLAGRVDALDAVLDECDVRYLEDAPFELAERRELFEAAASALAERLDGTRASAAAPDLQDEVFQNPLMVVIAAYVAIHGEAPPTTREALLDEVLAHERRYWRAGSAKLDADEVLLERMVAVATLVRAESEPDAAARLRLLPGLRDAPAERRNRLARWVRAQYPGPHWWNPLEPDLVGEHLVARCFTEQPEVLPGAIAGSEPREIVRPLEVLARVAADRPDLAKALSPVLSLELVRLCEVAVAQAGAIEGDDLLYGSAATVAAALNGAISAVTVDLDALLEAVDLMPLRADLVLNDLAATLTAQVIASSHRPLAEADPAAHAPDLAKALNDLSVRLANAGRRPEALAAIEEAAEIYRPLAEADPAEYAPDLARLSNTLSLSLNDAQRDPEALAASEEAVEIYRPLAEADPAQYVSDLAGALFFLARRLGDEGRDEEAESADREAAEASREAFELAARHADDEETT